MRYKATFIIGFAGGYVLGARAGRERYEAIARGTRKLMENPAVQETAGVLQAQAAGFVDDARRVVIDSVSGLTHRGHGSTRLTGGLSDVVRSHNGDGGP
ncbi:MAG: hypothetical protein QOG53_3608 [Frankiales bacterium]|jgi:hypothetical protein|nr:hypothetical protein [Frankiales bacterium]